MKSLKFETLSLSPELLSNLPSLGYHQMTPIQDASLSKILNNQDIIAQAKTGSGKTACFGLGLLSKLKLKRHGVQALVLCPTRELAEQVAQEIRKLARTLANVKVLTLCGGTPLAPQAASLEHGAHVVVGTPGRIEDHLSKRTLDLRTVQTLVLDEADRMLDMGFLPVINKIIAKTPSYRQTLLFSATFQQDIEAMSTKIQRNPARIDVEPSLESSSIEEYFFESSKQNKSNFLMKLLSHYMPESAVVFCNTKIKCQELSRDLKQKGFYAQSIHGDLDQFERDQALVLFANASSTILVATDVAARGLDIKNLAAVISYDIAVDPQTHVHRIGRTGRSGNKGLALNLYAPEEARRVCDIEKEREQEIVHKPLSSLGDSLGKPKQPKMISVRIEGGKRNKLRPTDILGALTKGGKIEGNEVGKINISNFYSIVAVSRAKADIACSLIANGKIKAKEFRARKMNLFA